MAEDLLTLFDKTAVAIRDAVAPVRGADRRGRTDRPGQYALDLVADKAALEVLHRVPATIVSEESGITGTENAPITIVIDPIDGSSNAVRDIPYWATSLCALDRGKGATRDGEKIEPSTRTRVEDAVVGISNFPGRMLPWKQFRALGSCALALCDVAYGALDGYFDTGSVHAPWDYLGGLLVCTEAGVKIIDADDRDLALADPSAKRKIVAAGTPQLLQQLRTAVG
jgi:fructose-1,6-bisphosphatase/inositol monophosphatase family enzyme